MSTSTIQNGEIRLVTKNPEVIIKVTGPMYAETFDEKGNLLKLDMYIQTNEFPRYHYVVILGLVDSYITPEQKFYIVKLITHSSNFDNFKLTQELYDNTLTTIDLTNSYITRDKFLIPITEVKTDKVYGVFDLKKLEDASEY